MLKFLLQFLGFVALFGIGISNAFPAPDDGDGEDDTPQSTIAIITNEVPVSSTFSTSSSSTRTSATSTSSTGSASTDSDVDKIDFTKFRWDADKSKYIRLGTTNDCPANMRFFATQGNSTTGQCDCDYYQCSRPLLYSPKTKECHFAWSRGPCEESEWYAFNKELQPICEPRKCIDGLSEEPVTSQTVTLSYWFVDPLNNGDGDEDGSKCLEAGSDETCTEEDESLLLYPGDPIPKCRSSTVCVPLGRPEPQICFKGNRRYYEGKCP